MYNIVYHTRCLTIEYVLVVVAKVSPLLHYVVHAISVLSTCIAVGQVPLSYTTWIRAYIQRHNVSCSAYCIQFTTACMCTMSSETSSAMSVHIQHTCFSCMRCNLCTSCCICLIIFYITFNNTYNNCGEISTRVRVCTFGIGSIYTALQRVVHGARLVRCTVALVVVMLCGLVATACRHCLQYQIPPDNQPHRFEHTHM